MVVPNGDNGPIVEVAAGLNHSLARDDAGRVWAWGSNEYGQLGLSDNNNGKDNEHIVAPTPAQVPGLPCRAVGISAGGSHSAILGEDGRVYTFGNPSNGQLSTGNEGGWRARTAWAEIYGQTVVSTTPMHRGHGTSRVCKSRERFDAVGGGREEVAAAWHIIMAPTHHRRQCA